MEVREYARSGVDPRLIGPFKSVMKEVGRLTLDFPCRRNVRVHSTAHGANFEYFGEGRYKICATQEGLGGKNWIAEWMRTASGDAKTYYEGIGWDTALMAVNDLIACGAMPVMFLDEVAAGDSEWFSDRKRSYDLAQSFFDICREVRMALPAGESPALRYHIRAQWPVESAPVLSGSAVGIIAPARREIAGNTEIGDVIIGFESSGIHCNGISALIARATQLSDGFFTKLPNGQTLGEEALIRTRSYVALVEALLDARVRVHRFLPGTGDGIAKLAASGPPRTYRIEWLPLLPPIESFMHLCGMSMRDVLTTFNCGIGYYAFVPPSEQSEALAVAERAGYAAHVLGSVEAGERCVIVEPYGQTLPPQHR